MTTDLTLPEELMLIALRDDRGTIEANAGMYNLALTGAVLTELFLAEAIAPYEKTSEGVGWFKIGAGTHIMVRVTATDADVDPLFRGSLEMLREASEEQTMQYWVQYLSRGGALPNEVARRLCERGVLREDQERVLFFFSQTVFPEVDPAPEAALKQRLEAAIFGDGDVDPRTALLVALAHPTKMLDVYFDRKALADRRERIEWLTNDNLIGDATHQAVLAVQAAQVAAVTAANAALMVTVIN